MSTRPLIENITFNGLNPRDPAYDYKKLRTHLGATWGVSLVILLVLFLLVDPDGDLLTRFNGSLFITLLIALPASYFNFKESRNSSTLTHFQENNRSRIITSRFSNTSFHPQSILSSVIQATDKYRFEQSIMEQIATGVRRNDQMQPIFFAGRVASDNSTYKQFLMLVIELASRCPHVLIDCDDRTSRGRTVFDDQLAAGQRFELEGNFADTFTLYAPDPESARFATYVLTPNVMEQLLTLAPTADIEIIDKQLFFIWKQRSPNNSWAQALPELFSTLNSIGAQLYDRASKYSIHTPQISDAKLRFNFVRNTVDTAVRSLEELPSGAGDAFDIIRRKGFWIMLASAFALFVLIITIEFIIAMSLGLL